MESANENTDVITLNRPDNISFIEHDYIIIILVTWNNTIVLY